MRDPDGGVKALWPLFGIANQLLASIALCLGTTIILKMQLSPPEGAQHPPISPNPRPPGRPVFAFVTLVPLVWLLSVTFTAGLETIFHHESHPERPRIGFLQKAAELNEKLPGLKNALAAVEQTGNAAAITAAQKNIRTNRMLHFNNRLDALVVGMFLVLAFLILLLSIREWVLLLARRRLAVLHETLPVWLPDYAIVEGQPLRLLSLLTLTLTLVKELSGEAHLDRSQQVASERSCRCPEPGHPGGIPASITPESQKRKSEQQVYVETVEHRFKSVNRCC